MPNGLWWTRTRWFAAEYLVVVAGILTAMALQAWQERGDRAQEQIYLRQLSADLVETQRLVSAVDSTHGHSSLFSARVLRAFYLPERPARDSVAAWFWKAMGFNEPRPVVGTAEALVSTGDLALIRDPEVRSAVTQYLEMNRQLTLVQHNFSEEWRRGYAVLRSRVDLMEIVAAARSQESIDSVARANPKFLLPAGARHHPFAFTVESLLSDRVVFEGLNAIHTGSTGMAGIRSEMLASARALHARIDNKE